MSGSRRKLWNYLEWNSGELMGKNYNKTHARELFHDELVFKLYENITTRNNIFNINYRKFRGFPEVRFKDFDRNLNGCTDLVCFDGGHLKLIEVKTSMKEECTGVDSFSASALEKAKLQLMGGFDFYRVNFSIPPKLYRVLYGCGFDNYITHRISVDNFNN